MGFSSENLVQLEIKIKDRERERERDENWEDEGLYFILSYIPILN